MAVPFFDENDYVVAAAAVVVVVDVAESDDIGLDVVAAVGD